MTDNPHPIVHLELHTSDLAQARSLYSELLRWRLRPAGLADRGEVGRAGELGGEFGGVRRR